jgi:hypothetical protein
MGYFAQQALDLLNSDLTVIEQLQQDFPQDGIGALRNLAGAFQFSGEDVDKKIHALSGGEKSRLAIAHALQPAELPGARRTYQSLSLIPLGTNFAGHLTSARTRTPHQLLCG